MANVGRTEAGPPKHLTIDPSTAQPPTRDLPAGAKFPSSLPDAKETQVHPKNAGGENASLLFVGTATTILWVGYEICELAERLTEHSREWEGVRLMTDPVREPYVNPCFEEDDPDEKAIQNFLHAGDHVHLGPGVTGTRKTNPAVDLHDLPRIDLICLSHYHADHFDDKVEASLRRDLPIITTPHAKTHLTDSKSPEEAFTAVHDLDFFQDMFVDIKSSGGDEGKRPALKVTGMPGKHVPPGVLGTLNDLVNAVPPTNGWMLELGYKSSDSDSSFHCGYRIYISGDTLLVPELAEIPRRYSGQAIDLMLVHLGGTTIPSPSIPLLMVTMDAAMGVQLIKLMDPDVTVPIHYDDYDVFLSPLEDFKKAVREAGFEDRVVYLDRKDAYRFKVGDGKES